MDYLMGIFYQNVKWRMWGGREREREEQFITLAQRPWADYPDHPPLHHKHSGERLVQLGLQLSF